MAQAKKLVTVLESPQAKKHVVRYDSDDADAAHDNIYVKKVALDKIGNPDKIKVTIEAA